MRRHPIFDELDASLSALMPEERVKSAGTWLPSAGYFVPTVHEPMLARGQASQGKSLWLPRVPCVVRGPT